MGKISVFLLGKVCLLIGWAAITTVLDEWLSDAFRTLHGRRVSKCLIMSALQHPFYFLSLWPAVTLFSSYRLNSRTPRSTVTWESKLLPEDSHIRDTARPALCLPHFCGVRPQQDPSPQDSEICIHSGTFRSTIWSTCVLHPQGWFLQPSLPNRQQGYTAKCEVHSHCWNCPTLQ